MYERLIKDPGAIQDALKHFGVQRINKFTIRSGDSEPLETDGPELIVPLTNAMDGYLLVGPGLARVAPLSTDLNDFQGLIHKGGATAFIPGPAKVCALHYTGSVDIEGFRIKAEDPQSLVAFDCGDGSYAVPTSTLATIGTSSGAVRAANAFRRYLLFQNLLGNVPVTFSIGEAAVIDSDPVLDAGSSYEMSDKNGNLCKGAAVNAIAAAAGQGVPCIEGGIPIAT